jgi:hypothetical protein
MLLISGHPNHIIPQAYGGDDRIDQINGDSLPLILLDEACALTGNLTIYVKNL